MLLTVGVLAGGIAASLPAGISLSSFVADLPPVRAQRVGTPRAAAQLSRGLQSVVDHGPPRVREAYALVHFSRQFTALLITGPGEKDRQRLEALSAQVEQAARQHAHVSWAPLQALALRLLALERRHEPLDAGWPAVQHWLTADAPRGHGHHQGALVEAFAREYERLGVALGTARGMADEAIGHPHGPLLQFLAERLERIADARQAAGDARFADACRTRLADTLVQCLLDSGSPDLRLLAADLLIRSRTRTGAAPELLGPIQTWRDTYRQAAARADSPAIAIRREALLAPRPTYALAQRAVAAAWLASAAVAAALIALGTTPWQWRAASGPRPAATALSGALVAALLAAGGVAWVAWLPRVVVDDFRGDWTHLRYWWKTPFAGAGLTAAMILLVPLTLPRGESARGRDDARARQPHAAAGPKGPGVRRPRAPRQPAHAGAPHTSASRAVRLKALGSIAATCWTLLALLTWVACVDGRRAARDFEAAVAHAYSDAIAAVTGPENERLLDALRPHEGMRGGS